MIGSLLFCEWGQYYPFFIQKEKHPSMVIREKMWQQFNFDFCCCKGQLNLLFVVAHHLKLVSAIFYCFFYFFTKWQPFKNYKKCFLFHLQGSFHSQDIQIFVIFSLPFHTFQIQKDKWNWNNLWCHELACINLQM